MEEDVDFGHVEGVKVVEQVPIHHVCEELEAVQFVPGVHQERAGNVRHALDIAHIRPEDREGRQDVLQWLI